MSGVILRASNEQISSFTPRLARKLPKDSRAKITVYLLILVEQMQEKEKEIGKEITGLAIILFFYR